MRMLVKRTDKKQSNKTIHSVEQLASNLFERIFVCSDCVAAYRGQTIIDSFVTLGISDSQLRDIVDVMDRSPTQKIDFDFTVTTGEVSKEVAKSFVVTTQQFEFEITGKPIATTVTNSLTGPSPQVQPFRSETKSTEEDEPGSTEDEDEDIADTSQDMSDLSTPSNLTIIDDVNQLLAEGRRRREERRIKQEAHANMEQASLSVTQTTEELTSDEMTSEDQNDHMEVDPADQESHLRDSETPNPQTSPNCFTYLVRPNVILCFRSNVRPLLTKWVDVWKTDGYGARKMKSRLCIMGNLENAHKLQT